MMITKRKTMNWEALVSKVGGLMGFIGMFVSRIVGYFTAPQFASLVANRLYTWKEPDCVTREFSPNNTDTQKGKKEEPVMFLTGMGFRRLWYRSFGVCCRDRYWNTYMKTLSNVEDDMKQ